MKLLERILGTTEFDLLIAMWFFAILGVIIHLFWDVMKRNPETTYSPIKFSLKYWWNDNWKRFTLSMLLVFVFIRFGLEFFGSIGFSIELISLFIGLSIDWLSEYLKEKVSWFQAKASVKNKNTE